MKTKLVLLKVVNLLAMSLAAVAGEMLSDAAIKQSSLAIGRARGTAITLHPTASSICVRESMPPRRTTGTSKAVCSIGILNFTKSLP
jgi:hypothetical protein